MTCQYSLWIGSGLIVFEHCYMYFTEVHVTELIIFKEYKQVINAHGIAINSLDKVHTLSHKWVA